MQKGFELQMRFELITEPPSSIGRSSDSTGDSQAESEWSLLLIPLSFKGDQHQISPCNISAL